MNPVSRVPLLVWFLIPTFIVVGIGVWFFSKSSTGQQADETKPAAVSKAVEGTVDYPIIGREHITQGTAVSTYNSNPPSSGSHWPSPAKNGIYDTQLADEQLIHDLEHGYIWISYKSDVSDDVKGELKKIVNDDNWKIVLGPRDKNETMIALVAWGRVLKLDTPDYDKIRDFIKTYRNRGPEKTPD